MTQVISPQAGGQTNFLSSSHDVVLYGGAAGSAKSYSLLLEALRHVNNPDHKAVIFRRTSPMLRSAGSIYNEAKILYNQLGATCNDTRMTFTFPSGATIAFSHLQSEEHRLAHQGAQYSFIGFDELTHFTESQFSYLLSRLRNQSINPYARATCNPDTGWVKNLVLPYLDEATQFPIEEVCGRTKYLGFGGTDEDSSIEFKDDQDDLHPLSFTFIPGKLSDNKILLKANPKYEQMLQSLPFVERQQLLFGDWNTSYTSGNIFKKDWFILINKPILAGALCLSFDLASTAPTTKNPDPDFSAAAFIQKNGPNYFIHDVNKFRGNPADTKKFIQQSLNKARQIAAQNGLRLIVRMETEPGSASRREIDTLSKEMFVGIDFKGIPSTKSKVKRSRIASQLAEAGRIMYYNFQKANEVLTNLEKFPVVQHDDDVDAITLGINSLSEMKIG